MILSKMGTAEARTSYTFPSLHQAVAEAVSNDIPSTWFKKKGNKGASSHEYSTNVMGKFRCNTEGCKDWSSKTVAILIRGYPGNGYHAVVFNQRCKTCDCLGILTLDEDSYVERMAYRLKRWAGVHMERPVYREKSGPPHERALCEGCKRGYCQQKGGREEY